MRCLFLRPSVLDDRQLDEAAAGLAGGQLQDVRRGDALGVQVQEVRGVGLVLQAEAGAVRRRVDDHVLELVAGAQGEGEAQLLVVDQRALAGIQARVDVVQEEGADRVAAVGRGVLVLAGEEAALFALGRAQVEVAPTGSRRPVGSISSAS